MTIGVGIALGLDRHRSVVFPPLPLLLYVTGNRVLIEFPETDIDGRAAHDGIHPLIRIMIVLLRIIGIVANRMRLFRNIRKIIGFWIGLPDFIILMRSLQRQRIKSVILARQEFWLGFDEPL